MDIDVAQLNQQFFFPYDLGHLLVVWGVLTVFLLVFASLLYAADIYPSAWAFWVRQLQVLGSVYLASTVSFLLLHLNPIGAIIVLLTIAFVVLGRVGAREESGPIEDWWLFRFLERQRGQQEREH